MYRRHLTVLASLAGLALAVPATSGAAIVGLGDQSPSTFSDPLFKALGVNKTRFITPYNSATDAPQKAVVDQWMKAKGNLQTIVAFNPKRGSKCPGSPCKLPSVKDYEKQFKAFRKAYPKIKIYQPWNETNSQTQPTTGKKGAKRAAAFYDVVKKNCRGCTVTGADIQDIGNFTGYVKDFSKAITSKPPKVWGFHNYTDTNRGSTKNTKKFTKAIKALKAKVWLTETGGIFSFTQSNGTVSLPPNENRAAGSVQHMYDIAKQFRSVIQRVYIYQWKINSPLDRFDAGIVNPDGSARKSYTVVLKNKSQFK